MPPIVEGSVWASLEWLGDLAKAATSLAVALSGIGLIVWWFLGEKVEASIKDLAGTSEILVEVDKVQEEQRVQGQVLTKLTKRVDGLEPDPLVIEFDTLRSRVYNPCKVGEKCEYVIRAKRTDYGNTCRLPPSSERIFVDSAGNKHRPNRDGVDNPTNLDEDWNILKGNFIVPKEASVGIGEFYLSIEYSKCGADENERIQAESIYLQVEVIK